MATILKVKIKEASWIRIYAYNWISEPFVGHSMAAFLWNV